MKISKTHQRFSKRLNQPDALTNPGKYLGPNWEDVLNFWIYVDTLGYQERKEISDLYLALECDELWSAIISARHAVAVVVGEEFIDSAWLTAYNATGCAVFSDATCELIGSHKLLEQNKTPTFLPLCSTTLHKTMKISKTHQEFSERLNQPDALTNPGKYLGPNYQDVLNFWIYLDTLSVQERGKIDDLYWSLDENVLESAIIAARDAAEDVVGREFRNAAWDAACNVTGWFIFGRATDELIGSHKILDQNKTTTFLQLCIKP